MHDPRARVADQARRSPAIPALGLRAMAITSFRRLPTPMQRALWWTCIDPVDGAVLCRNLGVRPGEAMALELRAWLQVRQEWLAIAVDEAPEECRGVLCALGPYGAGALSPTDTARCEAHFGRCDRCPILVDEFIHLTERLARAVSGKRNAYQVPESGPVMAPGSVSRRSPESLRETSTPTSEYQPHTRRARHQSAGG